MSIKKYSLHLVEADAASIPMIPLETDDYNVEGR